MALFFRIEILTVTKDLSHHFKFAVAVTKWLLTPNLGACFMSSWKGSGSSVVKQGFQSWKFKTSSWITNHDPLSRTRLLENNFLPRDKNNIVHNDVSFYLNKRGYGLLAILIFFYSSRVLQLRNILDISSKPKIVRIGNWVNEQEKS